VFLSSSLINISGALAEFRRTCARQYTSVAYDRHKRTKEPNEARTYLLPRRLHLLSVGTMCRYILPRR